MRQISFWAKAHKWQSRAIIVLIYILLNIIGFFTGQLLKDIHVIIPSFYFTGYILFTIILWVCYPGKHTRPVIKVSSYVYRKTFDLLLGAVTYLMIIYAGNNKEHLFMKSEPAQAFKVVHSKDSAYYNNPLIRNFIETIQKNDVNKLTTKQKIKLVKQQIKIVQKDKTLSKGEKAILIILSVFVAMGLLAGVGALSCSLSCSGSEAAAAIVGLGGTFLIIFLLVVVIKRITKGRRKKDIQVEEKLEQN